MDKQDLILAELQAIRKLLEVQARDGEAVLSFPDGNIDFPPISEASFACRGDALMAAFPELTASLLEDIKAIRSSLERQGVPVTSGSAERGEIPCFVPLGTRTSREMAKAIGVDTTQVTDLRFEFGEPGLQFVVLRRYITPEEMARAIRAVQAIDPEAPL